RLFLYKQKTAYEILADWSSDVCSSDLLRLGGGIFVAIGCGRGVGGAPRLLERRAEGGTQGFARGGDRVRIDRGELVADERFARRSEERRVGKAVRSLVRRLASTTKQ